MRIPLKYLLLTGILSVCIDADAGHDIFSALSRAESFSYDTLGRFVRNQDITVDWHDGDRYFHYCMEDSTGIRHFIVDTRSWKKKEAFDNAVMARRLAGLLSDGSDGHREKIDPENLGIYFQGLDGKNADIFRFMCRGQEMEYDISKDILRKSEHTVDTGFQALSRMWHRNYSADSLYYVTACGHNMALFSADGRDSVMVTSDGEQYHSFAVSADSPKDSDEKSSATGLWVGKSHKYFFVREDKREVGTMTLVNSLARPRPSVKTYKYAFPGDEHVTQYEVYLLDAENGTVRTVDAGAYPDQRIIVPRFNKFVHTDRYVWFVRTSRPSDIVDLCRVDVTDGSLDVLISEECRPHLNEQLFSWRILGDGEEILWWSERSGKGRFYLYDGEGRLKNAVTDDDFVSGNIVAVLDETREVIFEGYGREPGINPYYRFYYKASLDGGRKPVCLTPGNGTHDAVISPDRKYMADAMSRMDLAPQHRIFDMKGREKFRMEDADLTELYKRGWKEPLVMSLKAADGETDLYGVVYMPFDLDTTKKYPVISSVYPGPQIDLVPTAFFPDDNYNQSLAQMGFIVVNFAYRGSGPYRGRDFYAYGYGNLRDYPLDDDYAVIRQIGEKFSFADTTRVGIYGHSGGGFMTATAMMTRPDFYKVGVAASGNYDNNIYMQWWGESFHGVRQETGEDGSAVFRCDIPVTADLAGNLKGRLLLITGDMDNNVHPASTLRLADALIGAGKYFDMMIIPGADHGLGDKYYVNLIRLYFAEHLLGMDTDNINNN